MNLREYISNSTEVNRATPEEDGAPTGNIKLLGVKYDTKSDEFVMKVTIPQKEKLIKLDIVGKINSIYDHIGLASPLAIKLKSLMREIYDTGTEWKQYVLQELCIKWISVIQEINNVCIRVNRPLLRSLTSHTSRISFWMCCDASKMAISACAYLKCENTNEITSLISGKSKLTPKKIQKTIPCLELLAILIGLRMAKTILDSINAEIVCVKVASDSEIAKLKALTKLNQQSWLIRCIDSLGSYESYEEMEDNKHVNVESTNRSAKSSPSIADLARFSRYRTALRTFSVVGKLLSKWVKRCNYTKSTSITLNVLSLYTTADITTANDMDTFEKLILAAIHENSNVRKLQKKKRFPIQKTIRDDEGVIRYTTRIQNANLPYDTKILIFIPNDSELARLIILDLHKWKRTLRYGIDISASKTKILDTPTI